MRFLLPCLYTKSRLLTRTLFIRFYDFETLLPLRGQGARISFPEVNFTQIPVHIKGGSIIPLRANSANTTTELRKENFKLLIAPGLDGCAKGSLYLDDGESLVQDSVSEIEFSYDAHGSFKMSGTFGYDVGDVRVEEIVVLGQNEDPQGLNAEAKWNKESQSVSYQTEMSLTEEKQMTLVGAQGI